MEVGWVLSVELNLRGDGAWKPSTTCRRRWRPRVGESLVSRQARLEAEGITQGDGGGRVEDYMNAPDKDKLSPAQMLSEEARDAVNGMKKDGSPVSPKRAMEVLRGVQEDAGLLVRVFQELSGLMEQKSVVVYNYLLFRLGKSGKVEKMLYYFEEMKREGLEPDTVTYNSLMKGYSHARQLENVKQLYDEMLSKKVPCTAVTHSTLVGALVHCGEVEGAEKLLLKLMAADVELNEMAWSTLMNVYAKQKNVQKVKELLEQMESANVRPTSVSLAILMNAYVICGDVASARAKLDELRAKGKATADNYNVLLSSYARRRDFASAVHLFNQMEKSDATPDRITLNIMVNAASRAGLLEEARRFLEYGSKPDAIGFRTLLKGYGRAKDSGKELQLMQEMHDRGMDADLNMMTCLIHSRISKGRIEEAVDLFNSLPNLGITADPFLCNKMLCAINKNLDGITALAFFQQMQKDNLPTNEHTLRIVREIAQETKRGNVGR